MSAAVEFRKVDIVFGPKPRNALAMLDEGFSREAILERTGHVVGVADASLAVERGQICVLMGLSGSGKSTLLRAVNRLNQPSRGDVIVSHKGALIDVASCDAATLRDLRSRSVAMVFQQFGLLPWRTVRDNVGLGLELRGLARSDRDHIVDEKLAMVGLSSWATKHAHQLSGGMQQRVGLARAFATDADILLMDEPFSALDPLIRTKLQDELLELQARLKKTILFVSHDLDEAIKLGNRIVIMEGGRIIQTGSVADIVMRPATPYVSEFVRHMNPLHALKAATFMRPVEAMARDDGDLLPEGVGGLRLRLDERGCIPADDGVVRLAAVNRAGAPPRAILVSPDLRLKDAVSLRHAQNCPLLIVDGEDRLLGVVGEADIFRALAQA